MFAHELGATARCKISGYVGIVVCRSEWLYGCNHYVLQAVGLDDKGGPRPSRAVDEQGMVVIEPAKPEHINDPTKQPGGPADCLSALDHGREF